MPMPWDSPVAACGWIATFLAVGFTALWWRQTRTRDATSVDAAWAAAIGLIALCAAAIGSGAPVQRATAGLLGGIWSARLCWHLVRHRLLGHRGEDGRYRALREHWGRRADWHFAWFYQAQAAAAFGFGLPFLWLADHAAASLSPLQWSGIALFGLAQWAEARADLQLARHRADPELRGRTCRRGWWRYSRHPNYFFEWLSWCGIAMVVAPAAGWLAALQPAAMFVLVRFVSGVPYAELQALKSRGEDYRRYQATTNTFVPWLERRPDGGTR
jgi:steroid 5-alpha reductase family enzyme